VKYERDPNNIVLRVGLESLRPMIAMAVIGLLFACLQRGLPLSNITARSKAESAPGYPKKLLTHFM